MKNNENVNERKSFKEVVIENKGKIIAGVSIVATGAIGVVLYKNTKAIKDLQALNNMQVKVTEAQGNLNSNVANCIDTMSKELVKVRDIAKEGALEEAIATVQRKIQYRVNKIEGCIKVNTPESLLSKELYEKELEILKGKLTIFQEEWENMLH